MKNKFTQIFKLSNSLKGKCSNFDIAVAKLLTAITIDTRVNCEYGIRKSEEGFNLIVLNNNF